MTQPDPTAIQGQCTVVQTPDGIYHVGLQIHSGALNAGVLLDVDQAEAFINQLAAGVKQAAAAARRARLGVPTGLLIPTGVQLPVNGQQGQQPS